MQKVGIIELKGYRLQRGCFYIAPRRHFAAERGRKFKKLLFLMKTDTFDRDQTGERRWERMSEMGRPRNVDRVGREY